MLIIDSSPTDYGEFLEDAFAWLRFFRLEIFKILTLEGKGVQNTFANSTVVLTILMHCRQCN